MSAATIQPHDTSSNAGFPPAPSEPHQRADIALRAADGEDDEYEYVRFGDLWLDERNVRTDPHTDEEIEELADLIDAQGLLQNFTVVKYAEPRRVKAKNKKKAAVYTHGVIAGGGRWKGVHLLIHRGRKTLDDEYLCKVVPEARALAVSVAENSGRKPMSDADTIVAFADMVRDGAGVEELAVAFRLSPLTVQRRMKLANVAPKLFALFRQDEVSLDQLMALALTDDHAAQEGAWAAAPAHNRSPRALRALIAGEGLRASIVKFVGLPTYEKAGGKVLRDLFAEDDDEPEHILDPGLMMRLAEQKLEALAEALRATGMPWVEVFAQYGHTERERFAAAPTTQRQPTPEEAEAEQSVETRMGKIDEELEALYEDDDADNGDQIAALEDEGRALDDKMEKLQDARREVAAHAVEFSGAVIFINDAGEPVTLRHKLRKTDMAAVREALNAIQPESNGGQVGTGTTATTSGLTGAGQVEEKGGISERLCHQLTSHRTRALQASMLGNARAALAALVHPLLTRLVYGSLGAYESASAVQARAEDCESQLKSWAPDLAGSRADNIVQEAVAEVKAQLPQKSTELLGWLLGQNVDVLVRLLQVCSALSLNAISASGKKDTTATLANVLNLQMREWWTPTAESYLGSVSKALIVEALKEEGLTEDAEAVAKMKKAEAVATAQERLSGRGWVPAVLR